MPEPTTGATLPFELNTQRFVEKWNEYIQHRKEYHWPKLSPRSTQRQWDQFADWGVDAAIEAIDESIRQGYRGIFPPKQKSAVKQERPNFASLGALQLQLKTIREQITTLRNPSGQAWPPPLTGEKKERCDELIRQGEAIQRRIDQFSS